MKTWHWIVIGILGAAAIGAAADRGRGSEEARTVQRAVPETSQPARPSPRSGVTMANYQRIRDGMSYAEVVRILGEPGEEISSSNFGNLRAVMYKWDGAGATGANMNAMFQNDRLVTKAQFGLR